MPQPTVFISYSHKDETEKEALLTHLGGLQRTGLITRWSDDQIGAGAAWKQDIKEAIDQASVAILLVTASFLDSKFITTQEVPALLARQKAGGLVIVPVIARACAWQRVEWLQQMNVRPKNGAPVWREGGRYADEELARIAEDVAAVVEKMTATKALPQSRVNYLNHLVDRYRYLDFRGMGVSDRVPLRLPLLEMYVPLKARIELPEGETWRRGLRLAGRQLSPAETETVGLRLSEPQPVLELLRQHPGLVVLGDPGAGKTTFLKYLALRLAQAEGEALGLGSRLPVLLPLSAYANALAEADISLDRFIADYYHQRVGELSLAPLLATALADGQALLLLDGLDEVKSSPQRRLVVDRVVDFFCAYRRQGNKFILTSRIVGYREVRPTTEGLAECTLVDFEIAEITDFIDKWTTALERAARGDTPVAAEAAGRERAELLAAVARNPGVRDLAANPLLLTILALMKRQGITLPERRVELYQKYVETLLKHWNLARGLDRPASRDLDVIETIRVLAPLALWMHQTSPGVGLVKREALLRQLTGILAERGQPEPEQAARQLLADAREHASLLLERGAGEYGFIHLTFQEYLAAVAIAHRAQRGPEAVVDFLAGYVGDDNWREVTLLTIAYLGLIQQWDELAGRVVRQLIKNSPGEPGQAVVLAGQAVADAWPGGVDPATKNWLGQVLAKTMAADRRVKPHLRAAAGDALAKLGDRRPGVDLLSPFPPPEERLGVRTLPDLEFCFIPAGPFWLGSPAEDDQAYADEKPLHRVVLPYDYWLGRYPVTVAQFDAFVAARGYQNPAYWPEAIANGAWQAGKFRRRLYDLKDNKIVVVGEEEVDRPYDFGEPFNLPNHPAVGISWYEALAFCRWLEEQLAVNSEQLSVNSGQLSVNRGQLGSGGSLATWRDLLTVKGYRLTLPSEAEWEKAARGPSTGSGQARRYPWGDEPDPNRANYEDTKLETTSAVGCFPGGVSPYGCEEMSGNVWEWTRSLWGRDWQKPDFRYPYEPTAGRENLQAGTDVLRVLRGGSLHLDHVSVRCAVRNRINPHLGSSTFGFRLVVSPFSSDL